MTTYLYQYFEDYVLKFFILIFLHFVCCENLELVKTADSAGNHLYA